LWPCSSTQPIAQSRLIQQIARGEAIDYTLWHDDGRRLDGLPRADVVLVGVSRSGKSATRFYLAYPGVKAAYVPLVSGLLLPVELVAVLAECVIGLVVNASRLLAIRDACLVIAKHGVHRPRHAEVRSPRSQPRDERPRVADDQRVVHGDRRDRAQGSAAAQPV
jgi:regulator of PEP synthase PpsR (kinase-PPPase family)